MKALLAFLKAALPLMKELAAAVFARPAYDTDPADHPMNQDPVATTTKPVPVPPPQPSYLPNLNDLMKAMQSHEGWAVPGQVLHGVKFPSGSRSYRNNNPLNVRYSKVGYAPIYGMVLDVDNYAKFKTVELGWLYAKNLLTQRIEKHPYWTLTKLIGDEDEGWAPSSDNNNVAAYVQDLTNHMKIPANYSIKNFIA